MQQHHETHHASDAEVVHALAGAIARSSSIRLGRDTACFVATLSAQYLADARAQAGLVVVRRGAWEGREDPGRLL
jgi:hypothetical protein